VLVPVRDTKANESGSEQHLWRTWQRDLLRACLVIVFWAVHACANWLFFHQPGVEWLKATSDATWDRYAKVSLSGGRCPWPADLINATQEMVTFSFYSPMMAGMNGVNLGLPKAWVVKCKKCGCTITCRAIDPQGEHAQPDKAEPPPHESVIVTCSCCWAAFRYSPAEIFEDSPGPSSNCFDRSKPTTKEEKKPNAVLLIAASRRCSAEPRED
jgi:hypothetical protein